MDFQLSEFCITNDAVPLDVADKILKFHLAIGQQIRDQVRFPIWPSQKSAYRPVYYEIEHGRAGTSEHCFKNLGATDWTAHKENVIELLEHLKRSNYTRVCYYPKNGFIHCDYKGSERLYFVCEDGKNWIRQDEKR